MKYLTISAAALFLFAAPVAGFAQSDTSGGTGTNAGAGATTDQNTGGSGEAGSTGSQAATGSDSQCNDQTASSSYDSFSEKCRGQIDEWAKGQAGASTAFEGDVAVGVVVPDSVAIVEVPAYRNYGYVMLNDHRVLVDRTTRKVIHVY
jgi:hypothetical protein